jgi:hypothetical protein
MFLGSQLLVYNGDLELYREEPTTTKHDRGKFHTKSRDCPQRYAKVFPVQRQTWPNTVIEYSKDRSFAASPILQCLCKPFVNGLVDFSCRGNLQSHVQEELMFGKQR